MMNKLNFLIVTLLLFSFSFGQKSFDNTTNRDSTKSTNKKNIDSTKIKAKIAAFRVMDSVMNKITSDGLKKSQQNFENNKISQWQNKNFNIINSEVQKAKSLLKVGINYKDYTSELEALIKWKKDAVDGIVVNKDENQTIRNLTTTSLLLAEISDRTENQLSKISAFNLNLVEIQKKIDSLTSNKDLYIIPTDTIAKVNYFQRLAFLDNDLNEIDKNLKNAIDSIQKLEVKANLFKFELNSDILITDKFRKEVLNTKQSLKKSNKSISLKENIVYSLKKGLLVIVFYITNHSVSLLLLFFAIFSISFYLNILKKKYADSSSHLKYPNHVLEHPIASSIVVVTTLFQFILPLPPFIITSFLWTLIAIALTIILKKSLTNYWFKVWLVVLLLNIIAFNDNILLRNSHSEYLFNFFFSLTGILFGTLLFINQKKEGKKFVEYTIKLAFIGFIILEVLSMYYSLSGNFNLSKLFLNNGYFTILIAYFFVWTYYLINDIKAFSLYLKNSDEEKGELELDPEKKSGLFVYLIFFIGWIVLITRNSYFFKNLIEPFKDFLFEEQKFGEFSFTYSNVFVFFIVIILSAIISQIVSFLTNETNSNQNNKKGGIGSWLLLIRIGIITLGILIAFVSAGIPLDKLALVISALSVGIGFGLQTVINNLVSGLIIAFEKPINLNDIVEIGGKMGKMKSIGIRSSIVSTWEGSDVIIPNGDLLNQHLVNWTMGSNRRRFDFALGVAYGTDLDKVTKILENILADNENVLTNPGIVIQVTNFNNSSIDFVVKFWVQHFEIGNDVKSNILKAIDVAFKENNIEIPFPQQDVHIKYNAIEIKEDK